MADTNPLASGKTTSEYSVTLIASILSILVTVVGVASNFIDVAKQAGVGGKWFTIAATVVGTLGTILSALGYQVARSNVKTAAIAAGAVPTPVTPASTAAAAANLGA